MRKVITLLVALIIVGGSYATTIIIEPKLNAAELFLPIGKTGKQISLLEFSKISVKDFQVLSERKMNFFERITFNKLQKKINKSINQDGKIENKKLDKFLKEHYGSGEGKSQLTAALLCFFLGDLGIHRFYLGYTWQGIVQLLTLGGLGIWALIDFIRILTGNLQPNGAEYAKTL